MGNGSFTKGEGYSPGETSTQTGRLAVPGHGMGSYGMGRGAPPKKDIPFARLTSVVIFIGEGDDSTDSIGARDQALEYFNEWKRNRDNEHFRIAELSFEFITEGKFALYVIYSE